MTFDRKHYGIFDESLHPQNSVDMARCERHVSLPAPARSVGDYLSAFACSRSTNFWILPVEVFGKGPNTTVLGIL